MAGAQAGPLCGAYLGQGRAAADRRVSAAPRPACVRRDRARVSESHRALRRCAVGRADECRSDHPSAADHHERGSDRTFREVGHSQGRNATGDPPRDGRARCRADRHSRGAWLWRAAFPAGQPLFEGRRTLDVCARRARPAHGFRRLVRTPHSRRAPLHAGGSAARPVVPCLGGRPRGRANAARQGVPGDRLRHHGTGFRGDGQDTCLRSASAISTGPHCKTFWSRASDETGDRMPRRRTNGPRDRGGVRLRRPPGVVVDFKEREASAFEALAAEAKAEIRSTLEILSRIDLLPAELVPTIAERITIVSRQEAAAALPRCDVIFEGMPEILSVEAGRVGRGLAAGGRRPDHRLDYVDDTGRRSRGIDRTPRPLPQCALAQSGLSGAADRIVAGTAHRAGSDGRG